MGQMHFNVPDSAAEFFHASRWHDAYLCGIEGVPWQIRNTFHPNGDDNSLSGGKFTLSRGVDTSAKLLLTCPIAGIGYRVLTTCSLRCQDAPHRLVVELARGSCFRVRIQSDIWQRGGLSLSDQFDELLASGTQEFLDATQQSDQDEEKTTASALQAIVLLEQAASELGDLFATQSVAFRRTREPRLSTMMAVGVLPPTPSLTSEEAEHCQKTAPESATMGSSNPSGNVVGTTKTPASAEESVSSTADTWTTDDDLAVACDERVGKSFNAVAVRMSWGDVESDSGRPDYEAISKSLDACAQLGLRVIGGPIVDHRPGMLPDWLTLYDGDFNKLISTTTHFVEQTVNHFRGRVNLWNAASGLNLAGPLRLDDEQIMHFAVGILQTIRRCDPNTPVIVSLDQPCGEYLAKDQNGISPLHFADALLRSGLGLAGIGLNFQFGFSEGDTHPRSAIEFAQVIDRWATLNAPLLIQLAIAGAPGTDEKARFGQPPVPLSLDIQEQTDAWSKLQHEFAKPLIETMLAKQIVHAIVWEGWSDHSPHLLPHTGVMDSKGQPRPILGFLTELRETILM